jgi:multiple sugar transport system permease protein
MQKKVIGFYVAAIIITIWVLFPIVWTINSSVQDETTLHSVPPKYFPTPPVITSNYYYLFNIAALYHARAAAASGNASAPTAGGTYQGIVPIDAGILPQGLRNSVIVSSSVVVINMALASLAAYAFARIRFRGNFQLFFFTLVTRLFPAVAIIIPTYIIIRSLGLLDTVGALILVYSALTLPFSTWIIWSYLLTVPEDIEDAARLDGYSRMAVFRKIVFPIIKPPLMTAALFSFMTSYSEFFFAFNLTKTTASQTAPVVIGIMVGNPFVPVGMLTAAAVTIMIPPVAVLIVFRKYLLGGLLRGAVK